MRVRPFRIILLLVLFTTCHKKEVILPPNPAPVPVGIDSFIRGVDLSFTPEIRSAGTIFKYNNVANNILSILKNRGINTVRLRLWYSPASGHSNLQEVVSFATEITNIGLSVYLDIHYSDTWADPGNQTKPAAWQSLSFAHLKDSVYSYTKRVVQACADAGAKPAIVQIGNETNSGFLWNEGKVGGSYNVNWPNYAALLKSGIQAVKDVDPGIKTMIHFAGTSGADWFFSNLQSQAVNYDYIGLSYYPVWHGKDLDILKQDLTALVNTYNKPLIIAETAYPFTLGWNDYTNNTIGLADQIIPAYAASLSGQANFIAALIKKIRSLPNSKGAGICYWAPDWVAFRGPTATNGSSGENLALFDFNNNAVPALDSLGISK